jgi:hypothetical protein
VRHRVGEIEPAVDNGSHALGERVPVTIGKACVRAAMPPSTPGCRPLRVHSAILARSGKMPANEGWE